MSLSLTSPPAVEPISLSDAKAHLKIDTTDDDALITRLIAAARARAEWHTGRAVITQSWTLWLDCWPMTGTIEFPLPPLQGIAAVTTYAPNDAATVMSATLYIVDTSSAPARLALKPGAAPPTNLRAINGIAIAFTAGYGSTADTVPPLLKQAILSLVAFLYENRGEAPADLPPDVLAQLEPFRILKI